MGYGIPSFPWYTWVAAAVLGLLLTGVLWALTALVMRGCLALLLAAWTAGRIALIRLTGWQALSSYGTAHFAGAREIRRAGLFTPAGLPLGAWRGRTLREPKGGHVALFGPPRSGKSWGLIMPMLEGYPGSCVVSDLRGELYERTHAAREAYGPVYRFDPASPVSCNLNILESVRWGSQYEFGDLHRLAFHLLTPPSQEPPDGFHKAAVPLLMAIGLHCHREGQGSFPGVVQWMTAPEHSLKEKLDELLASPHPVCQAGARRTLDQSERLRASVWNAVLEPLVIFQDPLIAAHTAKSDLDLEELLHGIQPLSLYLCMGFGDIARLGVFLGALVDVVVNRVGSPTATPRHRVLLALDECANLGRLSELERAISYLQGSGTQCLLAFQNLQQVLQTYGPMTPLLASIGTQIMYCPQDVLTATAISTHVGQSTVTALATNGIDGTAVSEYEHARPLLTVDEVLRLGQDEALILTHGAPPIRATKLGRPTPLTTTARVRQHVGYYPWHYAVATACLVLALALWPIYARMGKTAQPASPPATATAPVPRLPSGAWTMDLEIVTRGEVHHMYKGEYASEEVCNSTLQEYRKGGVWKWTKVTCVAVP